MAENCTPNCYITTYKNGSKRLFFPYSAMNGGGSRQKRLCEPSEDDIKKSIARTRRKLRDLALENDFQWFGTLTNGLGVPDRDFFDLVRKKLSDYKRRSCPEFDYIIVPDRSGDNENRLHFHGFFKNLDDRFLSRAVSAKTGDFLYFKGNPVYNWNKFKDIGFSNFTKINDLNKASSYIAGYATKANWDLLSDCPRKILHSNGLKMPDVKFEYVDEQSWLGHDIQVDPNCFCMSNDFGYFVYIKKS